MELSAICRDNGRTVCLTSQGEEYCRRDIITCNGPMMDNLALLEGIAPTEQRIMIAGEPGVNKQAYAEYIHRLSGRSAGPYIRFDCAATQAALYEERLFGAQNGTQVRRGVLESAHGGTVLLDAVATIPAAFCRRMERLLENGMIVRVGGTELLRPDVRLLGTWSGNMMEVLRTKPELDQLIRHLSAVRIDVLPLRRRKEDIALLTLHYLEQANLRFHSHKRMGSRLFGEILTHDWPGNERELSSFVEQMVLVCDGEVLDDLTFMRNTKALSATLMPAWKASSAAVENEERSLKEQVTEYELMLIRQSIRKYGSLRKAAKALKTDPSVLSRKLSATEKRG